MIKTGLRDPEIALMETVDHCPFKHTTSKKSLSLGLISVTGNKKLEKTEGENMLTSLFNRSYWSTVQIDRHSESVLSKLQKYDPVRP